MTHEEAIRQRPSGAGTYWFTLAAMGLVGLGILLTAILFPRPNFSLRVVLPAALIFLLGAAQAAERLFSPISAAQRSISLSEAAKGRLYRVGLAAVWIGLALLFLGIVQSRDHYWNAIRAYGWLLLFVNTAFADLRGEKTYTRHFRRGTPINWQTAPRLQSDRWGQR